MRHRTLWTLLLLLGICLIPVVTEAAQATLTWSDNATNEMGYTVQRKAEPCAGSGTWNDLVQLGVNAVTYVDQTVVQGGTYCYRVAAWNTKDGTPTGVKQFSAFSNEAGITLPFSVPVAPNQLGVTAGP